MIRYVKEGAIGLITIDRPEARNAINGEVAQGIEAAIDEIESDPDVIVGVLTGAPPVFCAGADLKVVAAGNTDFMFTERGGFAGIVSRERKKPLIAAVDGPALAGGAEIVLSCDLVVASKSAEFGVPEVKRSLLAASAVYRLPKRIPMNIAMECLLTGDPISAARAHTFGLVNVLCEPGTVTDEALKLAGRITTNAPLAIQAARATMLELLHVPDADCWNLAEVAWKRLAMTEDSQEGPRAFAEKRPPVWVGR